VSVNCEHGRVELLVLSPIAVLMEGGSAVRLERGGIYERQHSVALKVLAMST
jgi:hypothetical protein